MADESLCIIAADKSSSGKVNGSFESSISNVESFIVEVMSNLKANRKISNREELVKHITFEFTEIDEATCNDILDKLANENKLIKKKYAKKDTFSLPSTNNKTESEKKNPGIVDL